MKKRIVTILSLLLAFVLCFALIACGGDNDTTNKDPGKIPSDIVDTDKDNTDDGDNDGNKDPDEGDSIKLSEALNAVNKVLTADGFTGTATYTLSSKNKKTITESAKLDKRGAKVKAVYNGKEYIVDVATGYLYTDTENGYVFNQVIYAGNIDCLQSIIAELAENADGDDKKDVDISVVIDEQNNTVTYTADMAEKYNKYLEPLYSAYAEKKTVGAMLDDYCDLLYGKTFDEINEKVWETIEDKNFTIGDLFTQFKKNTGVSVEDLLILANINVPAATMKAIKARTLAEVMVGAYNYMIQIKDKLPTKADLEDATGALKNLGMDLLNAMLFDKVDTTDIDAKLAEAKKFMTMLKFINVKTLIDTNLASIEKAADLYTAIKNGIKFKTATITVTIKLDDDKNIVSATVEGLISHDYTGEADKGIFADNDYRAKAELVIDEYKTSVEAFDIKFNPAYSYKMHVAKYVYTVTDNDVSVYYETAGKEVKVTSFVLKTETPAGVVTEIKNVADGAFKFDKQTSSFVFSAQLVKSALKDAPADTKLQAVVFFDDDENGYAITLVYLNGDREVFFNYVSDYVMDLVKPYISNSKQK